ncbi:MAG: ferritin-like domain-containing protein [Actinomycetes bacterium]
MLFPITRGEFFLRGARGGAAVMLGAGLSGAFAGGASADPLPNLDLAYARLLVGVELLTADFYARAVAAGLSRRRVVGYLRRALIHEQKHYDSVAGIIGGAGLTPATAADFDFVYPKGTFGSGTSILKLARQFETLSLGAYLGAIGGMQTAGFKQGLAQIAAAEAQHLAYFTQATGGKTFSEAFPPALSIDQVSNTMDAFTA